MIVVDVVVGSFEEGVVDHDVQRRRRRGRSRSSRVNCDEGSC